MALADSKAWKLFRLAALLVCLPIGACNCNNSGDAAAQDSDAAAKATAPESGDKDGKEEGAAADPSAEYPDDLYPDFNFGQFKVDERSKFVKLAKAELCPCPDSNVSLHECLQSREQRCELAKQAASMMGGMVQADYNETDILDKVAELVEASKQEHQFTLEDRPHKGNPDADVVIVEFADFECPYCKLASQIMDDVVKKYGDKVVVYYKHYPLPAHQYAELASRASVAAHRQGKFWPVHDQLFKNQKSLSQAKIISIAQRAGLNIGKFKTDLESPEVKSIVAQDRQEGEATGLTGTPTIFINGRRFLGDPSPDSLYQAVEQAIAEAEKAEGSDNTDTTTN